MGRLGISYTQVAEAAESLKTAGINPTVDGVRNKLGTGSKSTIVPYLRRWRSAQVARTDRFGSRIPSQLPLLVQDLYSRLQQEVEIEIDSLKRQIGNLFQANLEFSRKFDEIESQNLILIEKNKLLEKELSFLLQERTDLRFELKKLQEDLMLVE